MSHTPVQSQRCQYSLPDTSHLKRTPNELIDWARTLIINHYEEHGARLITPAPTCPGGRADALIGWAPDDVSLLTIFVRRGPQWGRSARLSPAAVQRLATLAQAVADTHNIRAVRLDIAQVYLTNQGVEISVEHTRPHTVAQLVTTARHLSKMAPVTRTVAARRPHRAAEPA